MWRVPYCFLVIALTSLGMYGMFDVYKNFYETDYAPIIFFGAIFTIVSLFPLKFSFSEKLMPYTEEDTCIYPSIYVSVMFFMIINHLYGIYVTAILYLICSSLSIIATKIYIRKIINNWNHYYNHNDDINLLVEKYHSLIAISVAGPIAYGVLFLWYAVIKASTILIGTNRIFKKARGYR